MSVMGTGIASAVAQASLQSQQEARRRDRRANAASGDAAHVQDIYEKLLEGLEELEETESSPRVTIEEQLPDHQPPPQELVEKREEEGDGEVLGPPTVDQMPQVKMATGSGGGAVQPVKNSGPSAQLYHHLDVEA